MRILFVSRAINNNEVPPIIKRQGESLVEQGLSLDYYLVGNHGLRSYLRAIWALKKMIQNNDYSIIHAHYGLAGIPLLLTFTKTKKILSLMGSDILASNNKEEKARMSHVWLTMIIKKTLGYYDGLIVKSNGMKKIIPHFSPEVIPNGIALDIFKPMDVALSRKELGLKTNDIIFLFPANKNRLVKNYLLFSEAVALLQKENLNVKTIWFDNIPHIDTLYYFNSANVVVLTSLHEGSPNVIKEAMACNRPIVSVDVGDVNQIIEGIPGCFLASRNAQDLANKMMQAVQYSETIGRQKIKYLDSNIIAKKIINKYKAIIDL